jgi:hypothetical protein
MQHLFSHSHTVYKIQSHLNTTNPTYKKMKKALITLLLSGIASLTSNAAPAFVGSDLISLGSSGIGSLDSQSSSAFVQSSSATVFNSTAGLGDTFYNFSAFGPVNWTSSDGLYIRSTITTNPNLPITVKLFDSAFTEVAVYSGATNTFTTGTNQADSTSYSYLNLAAVGSPSLSNVAYLQFTFDGGGATNITLNAVSTAVPEPSTYALMAIGGLVVFFMVRRRKVQA